MKEGDDAAVVTSKNCASELEKARGVEIQSTNEGTGLCYNRGEGGE